MVWRSTSTGTSALIARVRLLQPLPRLRPDGVRADQLLAVGDDA